MPTTAARIDPSKLCDVCAGNGFVPTFDMAIQACEPCNGSGYKTTVGDLGPTHSEKVRPYSYEPACRRLILVKGKKPTVYTVGEFTPDTGFAGKDARAFQIVKHATGEAYCVLIGRSEMSCDCAGKSYEASAKANQRAYYAGEKTFRTLGCKHLDAVAVLLRDGWLDLPEGKVPQEQDEPQMEECGYCCGRGQYPGPTHDNHGYEITQRMLCCEYCGGSGVCERGGMLEPNRRINQRVGA